MGRLNGLLRLRACQTTDGRPAAGQHIQIRDTLQLVHRRDGVFCLNVHFATFAFTDNLA